VPVTVVLLARRAAILLAFAVLFFPLPFLPIFNQKYNALQIKNSAVEPID